MSETINTVCRFAGKDNNLSVNTLASSDIGSAAFQDRR
jgi:hypothetical protein